MVGTFLFMECWIDLFHLSVLGTFRYIIIIHYTYTSLIIIHVHSDSLTLKSQYLIAISVERTHMPYLLSRL